jgi:hypothetical protein
MAAWQVELYILPRRALVRAPQPLTHALLAQTEWWKGSVFPRDYVTRLNALTALAPVSDKALTRWGPPDGNAVEVTMGEGRVARVRALVDVRKLDSRFGAALLMFVRAADALLVRGDGMVVEPSIDTFARALRGSAAWRYASDPLAFLAARERDEEATET